MHAENTTHGTSNETSILDTLMVDGKPLGKCTAGEARRFADRQLFLAEAISQMLAVGNELVAKEAYALSKHWHKMKPRQRNSMLKDVERAMAIRPSV